MMGKTRPSRDPAQHTAVRARVMMSKAQEMKFTEKLKYFSVINSFDKSFKNPCKRANEPSSLFCFTIDTSLFQPHFIGEKIFAETEFSLKVKS